MGQIRKRCISSWATGHKQGYCGNNATFWSYGYTISPYYRTEAGAHENSDSPYGTFDQGGNVWEWNEAILSGSYRGLRGGGFDDADGVPDDGDLHASYRQYDAPTHEIGDIGFRVVAQIPESSTLLLLAPALLGLGGVVLKRRK